MVYSAFCTYFLNKHVSEIPLPGNDIQQVSIPQSSTQISDMAWPWCFPSHNVQVQMQHQLTVACSWAFLLKQRILEALFKIPSQYKPCCPSLSSSLSGQDGYQGSALAFRPLWSVVPQPVCSLSPSRVKRRKNRTASSLVEYIVVGYNCMCTLFVRDELVSAPVQIVNRT
jgi:hypothetical protein